MLINQTVKFPYKVTHNEFYHPPNQNKYRVINKRFCKSTSFFFNNKMIIASFEKNY